MGTKICTYVYKRCKIHLKVYIYGCIHSYIPIDNVYGTRKYAQGLFNMLFNSNQLMPCTSRLLV